MGVIGMGGLVCGGVWLLWGRVGMVLGLGWGDVVMGGPGFGMGW